ncbi:hypothetical protein [Agromyces cerinus]|uniref:Uncharacterized protein n=1 Tax=Agromyces cerinus subsp. cerinus TaxID=232089 RepID=A0A1N6I6V3_9MICO|nr:hypothetical protein [Agromyces cerinus]SIO27757.1 hypothetical protein SAMN05443544_3755 [Agromyces cerinus subsp. cerinus]
MAHREPNDLGSIALSDEGLAVTTSGSPEVLVPWDEIDSVAVDVTEIMGEVHRAVVFDHVSGEFFEISDRADGWEEAIEHLGDHMALLVDAPLEVCREARPDAEPIELARRREG